jgi:hypothetical protein
MSTPPKSMVSKTNDQERPRGKGALSNHPPALSGVPPEDLRNLAGFFRVLLEWDEERRRTAVKKSHHAAVILILPRFHGHLKSHASAVGVFNHGTEEKVVQRGV